MPSQRRTVSLYRIAQPNAQKHNRLRASDVGSTPIARSISLSGSIPVVSVVPLTY